MKTFGEFYASHFGSPNLPHGLSKSDLVMTGDRESIYEQCDYYQKHGDHKWRCSDCDKKVTYDEEKSKHIEHNHDGEDCSWVYCKVCDMVEGLESEPALND